MATQNLFEKYGIKEVADVTFYRIEKKEETYESQREFSVASILKGAVELRMVYPMVEGVGSDEGFEAYVFTDANVLTGVNYDCDDDVYTSEAAYGASATYDDADEKTQQADTPRQDGVGTHEFTYPQQAFMLFAKRQNLIAKTGTRYQFTDVDTLMGNLTFLDDYASGPSSTEKVVILAITGTTGSNYNIDEVNEALKGLTTTYKAKAYDVSYGTFAELVVEDEMGYYNPKFLGKAYNRAAGTITPFGLTVAATQTNYGVWAESAEGRGTDVAIKNATTWGNDTHYSINDAIDALRQKKLVLDVAESSGVSGIEGIFGGYKVASKIEDEDPESANTVSPTASHEDTEEVFDDSYEYSAGSTTFNITSKYPLQMVLDALTEIGYDEDAIGKTIRVDYDTSGTPSNRAIYVRVSGAIDTAAGAYIYLLHNKNYRALAADENGIFSFEDRKGNTLYYQDKIFKKVEWLALVIIGNKGLIYVVNRHGSKTDNKIAWLVNDNGYITNTAAKTLVGNGLIHTTDVTVNNETFEATAAVTGLKIHKVKKTVNRYTPVLFLDTLKVTNINQTAEQVYATGGRGNANLIGWDYGKEITLHFEDALFTPASMSATFGAYEGGDFRTGVKDVKELDRMEKVVAARSFIVPAGNSNGTPSEADHTAQAVYVDPNTMEPYQDGTPIAEGEVYLKWTRSIAYEGNSLGSKIEISADKFPGTYKIVGDTFVRSKDTGEDQRFQFVVNQAKMGGEQSIELSADGDPVVFNMDITVLRPDNGCMMQFIQYDVVENTEENDGSTMVKNTENLNLLDDAELFKVSTEGADEDAYIGATEY